MTYHRLYKLPHNAFVRTYFKGTSVRNHEWVKDSEQGTILPTEDAENVKRYFRGLDGSVLELEPVLPEELKNAIKT